LSSIAAKYYDSYSSQYLRPSESGLTVSPFGKFDTMNGNLISALSALAGAVIGGVMSLLASWVANQRQVRSQWIARDRSQREDLYKEFIEEAAKCYIDALLHGKPDISSVVVPVCQSEPHARPVVTSGRAANPTNYKYLLRAG
jgi:hypothetical protein